ncbi:hypothetical protein [Ramlibacter sp. Leaf400]|uniref:hypothetical protein n=1 Tax=Ramlibacter sp. Leaf400 TaxID=1736365 RepID=UPI0012E35771|nr:hypothetical protein [Ramlibacter sp. Leaf400]
MTKSMPPGLMVSAKARVPTPGWRNALLVPWTYVTEPDDGIWDFDFLASPPTSMDIQVISGLDVQGHFFPAPRWCRGVRVHGSQNSIASGEKEALPVLALDDRFVPFPWARRQLIEVARSMSAEGAPARDPGDAFPWTLPATDSMEIKSDQRQDSVNILNEPISTLIGPPVRIFSEGDAVTMDYRKDRINIVRAKYGSTIVRVFRG